jgi:hypothetical protein
MVSKSGFSQTIYTDINPDKIINADLETASVDMDNNGDWDFTFIKYSGTTSNSVTHDTNFHIAFWCGPAVEENSVAGDYATFGAGYGTRYYPYKLLFGELISNDLSFANWGFQFMGNGLYDIDGDGEFHYDANGGRWGHAVDSAYLGVRFRDDDNCLHYGWIRLSITDTLRSLIIHDYGYEERCGVGLYAGDTTMLVPVQNQIPLDAQVFAHGHEITIITDVSTNTMASIFDINGKLVMSLPLNNNTTTVAMNFPGVFLVEVRSGIGTLVKKVIVQ